jgi:hypothetical protein
LTTSVRQHTVARDKKIIHLWKCVDSEECHD